MRIIDAHIHVLDRSWIPAGVRYAWARQATGRREPMRRIEDVEPQVMVKQSDPTAEITMKAFERVGVEAALIPVVDWTLVAGRDPNDLTIDQLHDRHDQLAIATDGRLRYCAGIDPRHPDARERLAQVVTRPHCAGIKLYPAGGWSMSDRSHWWIFEFANDHQVPVVIHTSPLGGDPLVTPNSRPSEIAPAMAAFPSVSWVFAHAGFEAWWLEAVDIASGWQSAYLDLSLWQICAQNDYEEFRKRIRTAVSRVGAHRILFGSDIIRGPGEDEDGSRLGEWIKLFIGLGEPYKGTDRVVSEQDLELMLAGNAARLYGFTSRENQKG